MAGIGRVTSKLRVVSLNPRSLPTLVSHAVGNGLLIEIDAVPSGLSLRFTSRLLLSNKDGRAFSGFAGVLSNAGSRFTLRQNSELSASATAVSCGVAPAPLAADA